MEPALNSDLSHAVDGVDLTLSQLRDMGWYADADVDGADDASDRCANSDLRATIVVDGCETAVVNSTLGAGCTISDELGRCADGARNHAPS
jgi:hypothetical protein